MLPPLFRNMRNYLIGLMSLLPVCAQDSAFTPSEYQLGGEVLSDTCPTHRVWIMILSESQQIVREEGCIILSEGEPYELRRHFPTDIQIESLEAWEIEADGRQRPLQFEVRLRVDTVPAVCSVSWIFRGSGGKRRFQVAYKVQGLLRGNEQEKEVLWWPLEKERIAVVFLSDIGSYVADMKGVGENQWIYEMQGAMEIWWLVPKQEKTKDFPANSVIRLRFRREGGLWGASSSLSESGMSQVWDTPPPKHETPVIPALVMVIAVITFLWAWALSLPLYGGGEDVVILEGELPAKDPPAWVHAFVAKGRPTPLGFLAAVLDLARRGYVYLIAQGEKLTVKLLRPADQSLHPHERHLLSLVAKSEAQAHELKGTITPPGLRIPSCFEDARYIYLLLGFYNLLQTEIQIAGSISPKPRRKVLGFFLCCAGAISFLSLVAKASNSHGVYAKFWFFSFFFPILFILSIYIHKSLRYLMTFLILWHFLYSLLLIAGVLTSALSVTWKEFWYSYIPLDVSFCLFFVSAYFIVCSFYYTDLGKERKRQWERFEEWLIELPLSSQELAKYVEIYVPYAIALGVPGPVLTYVSECLGTQPAPAWFRVSPPPNDPSQLEKHAATNSPTMRQAMETIEKIVDSILSHAKGVQKGKNTNTKPLSLPEVYPPSLAYFLSKSQAYPSKRQLDYSSYFRTAYKVGIVGILVMVISLFLMMRSLETVGWWKEVINKGAFLLIGLSFIFVGINMWMTAKRRVKDRKISEKIRSLWKLLKDRGKMKMEEIATHLGIPRADVPAWIYRLGASEAFTGYVDWKDGVLYSVEAGLLGEGKDCPQCGGRLELAKKGIFQCQHCGAEVFLKK